jgi:hypothetical protein
MAGPAAAIKLVWWMLESIPRSMLSPRPTEAAQVVVGEREIAVR